jgi:hypothetical protein
MKKILFMLLIATKLFGQTDTLRFNINELDPDAENTLKVALNVINATVKDSTLRESLLNGLSDVNYIGKPFTKQLVDNIIKDVNSKLTKAIESDKIADYKEKFEQLQKYQETIKKEFENSEVIKAYLRNQILFIKNKAKK